MSGTDNERKLRALWAGEWMTPTPPSLPRDEHPMERPVPQVTRIGGLATWDDEEPAPTAVERVLVWCAMAGISLVAWLGFFVALRILGEWIRRLIG